MNLPEICVILFTKPADYCKCFIKLCFCNRTLLGLKKITILSKYLDSYAFHNETLSKFQELVRPAVSHTNTDIIKQFLFWLQVAL